MGNKVSNILGRGIVNDTRKIILLVLLKYAFFTCCLTSSEPSKAKTKASTSFFCSKHDETASSVLLRKIKLINFYCPRFIICENLEISFRYKNFFFLAVSPLPKCSKKSSSPFSSPFFLHFLFGFWRSCFFIIICIFEQRLFTCFR